jgi:hypothetical protein
MSCRILIILFGAVVLELLGLPSEAQTMLHYQFKAGERLQYHYKVSASADVMRRRGGKEYQTNFEADPEWDVEDVSVDNEARAILTVRNRMEIYRNGNWHLNFLHFTPQSEIAMNNSGALLYAKILIDDTERSHTKQYVGKIPGLRLLPDIQAVGPYFERLWYTLDTVKLDTIGTPITVGFDSSVAHPFEHDTMVYGRLDTFVSTQAIPYEYRYKGTTAYSLRDTVVGDRHFWALDAVTDEETSSLKFSNSHPTGSHRSSVVLFRKEDCILQSWHYTLETHANGGSSNSEMWLTLTSIEGS